MPASADDRLMEKMVAIRRKLHRHPELSGEETMTADAIGTALKDLGIKFRSGVGGTGIVADLPGKSKGKAVALRADMDALPVKEETNLEFASEREGVMHACGHDGHVAALLGAAELLLGETELPAPVRLIFQPAEEKAAGAKAMIEDGALTNVGLIFGGHLDRHYKTGAIVVTEGPVNASSDRFLIEITGHGGHGARPHESVDAVVVGSLMVMALQTIVSREVDPAHPSVVSVGLFQAGSAANVISGNARLEGTVRAQEADVRLQLNTSIKRIAESIAHLHGAQVRVEIRHGTPPLINTPEMAALAREAAEQTVSEANVFSMRTVNMGGEDFSYYLESIPGAYVRFGAQVPGLESFPAHSSKFDFDEGALGIAAKYLRSVAVAAGRRLAGGA
jgi:amidohydrolase